MSSFGSRRFANEMPALPHSDGDPDSGSGTGIRARFTSSVTGIGLVDLMVVGVEIRSRAHNATSSPACLG